MSATTDTNAAIAGAQSVPGLVSRMIPVVATDARALPALINNLAALDPSLVQPVQAKALLASKSAPGTLLAGVIAWLAAKYGFGWDAGTVDLVAGLAVLLGGYVMRYVTKAPIGGVVSAVPSMAPGPSAPVLAALLAVLTLSACATPPTPQQRQQIVAVAGSLASIAAANNTTVAGILEKGAAVCGQASSIPGQLLVDGLAVAANAAGVPVSVTNAGMQDVADACAAIGRVPGPLPVDAVAAAVPIVPVQTVLPPVVG